ncbi:DUF6527 family protein [Deinococcus peraridilitoris]|uniref:Uncharacterized protein n=1 Tax=Deinococcus peraridilitoris (strain DSM 19664 / LMG 22246 / CIP 109416 / KR-200) TaxID=937777 RepID=L0A2F1_DEIPD|nr:DUF6527 family protein [Deinococcus peraridilitoris]AFZ67175.1 hypothetical protein Deipe_1642 [Deinococcus peraridilitoris DSM 19664]
MTALHHEFVTAIPARLEDSVVYVSIVYATVAHKCACGCGQEVNLPLSPTDWSLIYDGETVSLSPSIGNWSLPCQSHYWIKNDKVVWAKAWSQKRIEQGRKADQRKKGKFFAARFKREQQD